MKGLREYSIDVHPAPQPRHQPMQPHMNGSYHENRMGGGGPFQNTHRDRGYFKKKSAIKIIIKK